MKDQCDARVAPRQGGHRCQYAARHTHITDEGHTVKVCNIHLRMLDRRERGGSDEEVFARWRKQGA